MVFTCPGLCVLMDYLAIVAGICLLGGWFGGCNTLLKIFKLKKLVNMGKFMVE